MGQQSESRVKRASLLMNLRPYFRQVSGLLVLGSLAGIAMNVAVILPPILLGHAINVVLAFRHGHATASDVKGAASLFVVGTAATEIPRIGKRWWLGVARARLQANVRSDAFRGVLAWPFDRVATMSVGGVMARVVGDVETLGLGVGEIITETWDTLLFSASLSVTMFVYDPSLAALALIPVPVALWIAKRSGRLVARRTYAARQQDADFTTVLHEQLSGHMVLRLSGRRTSATRRVAAFADRQAAAELDAIRLDEALTATYTTMLALGALVVIWLGGRQVAEGSLSVGGLVAFLALFVRFITRAPRIPQMANRVQASAAAYARLEDLLAVPVVSGEPRWSSFRVTRVAGPDAQVQGLDRGASGAATLSFRDVGFAYGGSRQPALEGIDLDVPAGSLVAVTGPVGCGKSTLARLAVGLLEPDHGQVLLDGSPLSELSEIVRTASVGFVSQEPHLFSGSILQNVTMDVDEPAARQEPLVARAIEVAALGPDIAAMREGMDTQIGELGVRLSGGQRQRIALARAIAANGLPRLLVLDDPFSAVDVKTEASIITSLRSALLTGDDQSRTTVVLFSHRLAAFPVADFVVVLEHGRIAEAGHHHELIDSGGLYQRIYRAQSRILKPSDTPTDGRGT